jgi:5'-phosphate synthase pdxT subunit
MKVGILALQGSFEAHTQSFARLGAETVLVRLAKDLDGVTHVVIPGGESTTMHHLMSLAGLQDALRDAHERGSAFWGTCAGAILLGRESDERPPRMNFIDLDAERNAYGRQVDSFAREISIPAIGEPSFHAVFIRAPKLSNPAAGVNVLACDGDDIVLARQGRILVSTFHPELTPDPRLHRLFLELN